MENGVLLAIIGIAEAVITAIVTFVLTKKKYYSEVDSNVINNMRESLNFYKDLADDNRKRLTEVLENNKKLEDEVSELRKVVYGMLAQICTDVMCQNRQFDRSRCPYIDDINKETALHDSIQDDMN